MTDRLMCEQDRLRHARLSTRLLSVTLGEHDCAIEPLKRPPSEDARTRAALPRVPRPSGLNCGAPAAKPSGSEGVLQHRQSPSRHRDERLPGCGGEDRCNPSSAARISASARPHPPRPVKGRFLREDCPGSLPGQGPTRNVTGSQRDAGTQHCEKRCTRRDHRRYFRCCVKRFQIQFSATENGPVVIPGG